MPIVKGLCSLPFFLRPLPHALCLLLSSLFLNNRGLTDRGTSYLFFIFLLKINSEMNIIKVKRRISSSLLRISELKEFVGKHVEITVAESVPDENPSSEKVAAGILSDFKDKKKITSEKQAWGIAASKKHGNN
jgi:hypothetical protein